MAVGSQSASSEDRPARFPKRRRRAPPPPLPPSPPSPEAGPCRGSLSYDDTDIGLNNQLASLALMLCVARTFNVCELHGPPLGYHTCGTHMPCRQTVAGKRPVFGSKAALTVPSLLRLAHAEERLLTPGPRSTRGCNGTAEVCKLCGPYNVHPYKCVNDGLQLGTPRVHMLYAFGLVRHLHRSDTPTCMRSGIRGAQPWHEKPLQLAPAVEQYAEALMARLHLEPGRFIAVQYLMGYEWKNHVSSSYVSQSRACTATRTPGAGPRESTRHGSHPSST